MSKLPYQIERVALPRHGSQPPQYRFDLLNTATGKVIAFAFRPSPFPPTRLARRLSELNAKHLANYEVRT